MPAKKKTQKLLGVIGYPISHSLSPVFQNAAIKKLGLPLSYKAIKVKPQALGNFVRLAFQKKYLGFNVTIPHKEHIIKYLDLLTPMAKKMGAVNTVKIEKNGKLIGHNTDGLGYLESLKKECHFNPKGKLVVLLGAGGAAKAIATALGNASCKKVLIANRNKNRAPLLAQQMKKNFPRTQWETCFLKNIPSSFWSKTHLLVNATSMGMKNIPLVPLPLETLHPHCIVSDIVYHPLQTSLLKKAKTYGLKIHPGWGMLLYQGALSFTYWTNKKSPLATMKKNLLAALKTSS
ncbi:MAG: shikimate dehydrogenase [Deltaproteobacteria bacterium RIFCSPLOWO2_12_FULL_40_28]|nr:MAG: shikimate dehydrogenase [Deltaproteobacteria bacterium RIFCSPHIGHO2_02_FULL_40_28]OGQ20697.1 MAG: shikimate dehydrogenase [Deltaproteobacteria bacterium RIFCSPHIGHO2_12_FULL_40_32]OGQ38932.1 MAG: shikimate dehydrogenase [Deltaproteobacteria bacterium RIFCSPLOWO2_02_FULL_40_36]OGQ55292.1 MAG: shikimate dehydrogenase [Deltaproteobacteria bacterium RIFCSPLOWO2_12_FULL_40_28]